MKKIFCLDKKIAVVTGGAGLLGRAIVETLAAAGAKVYIADNDQIKAESLLKKLNEKNYSAKLIGMDLTDHRIVVKAINKIKKEEKRVDLWVNNAYPRTADWGYDLARIKVKSWKENVDMHLNSYCLSANEAARAMAKQKKGGCIINMGSIYGLLGPEFGLYKGLKMTMPPAYAAIKGGIINYTRYLAAYYGPKNVRVNSISPGGVYDGQTTVFKKRYEQKVPLRRMAAPNDIANAVLFLASDEASYITAHNLVVDGGISEVL